MVRRAAKSGEGPVATRASGNAAGVHVATATDGPLLPATVAGGPPGTAANPAPPPSRPCSAGRSPQRLAAAVPTAGRLYLAPHRHTSLPDAAQMAPSGSRPLPVPKRAS